MHKVKTRPADFPMTTSKFRMDLPVVLSLAGIVSVAAVIGAAAVYGGIFNGGSRYLTAMISPFAGMSGQTQTDLGNEISRLNQKVAKLSRELQAISRMQTTTSTRINKIEEAFTSTASISAPAVMSSSPYYRILETGWNADDMVTRKQKRDRIALLKSEAILSKKGQIQLATAPVQPRYAVELDSYDNIITARNYWQNLLETHQVLLGKLEPHLLPTLDASKKNKRVKLIIGPIKTATQAAQICSTLRSSGQPCQERLFSTSNIMVVSAPDASDINFTE